MYRNQKGWISLYEEMDAFWMHDENPARPHALLTSGLHSNGFFNSELVMENPLILEQACEDLAEMLYGEGCDLNVVERVVGPAMGAITMSHDLARVISKRTGETCLRAYVEKDPKNPERMVFGRTKVREGEIILLCEDVITTGKSVMRAVEAVKDKNAHTLHYIAALVNRSGIQEPQFRRAIALIDKALPTWAPDDGTCPYCKMGSEAIRPKDPVSNWALLTAAY